MICVMGVSEGKGGRLKRGRIVVRIIEDVRYIRATYWRTFRGRSGTHRVY
jgi:hypothetical protein